MVFSWASSVVPIVLQNIMTKISWLNSIMMLGIAVSQGKELILSHSVILIAVFFLCFFFFGDGRSQTVYYQSSKNLQGLVILLIDLIAGSFPQNI